MHDQCLTSNHANIEQSKKSHWLPPRTLGQLVTSQDRKRIISAARFNSSAVALDRSLKHRDVTDVDGSVESIGTLNSVATVAAIAPANVQLQDV